jgi:hypothetical protein
MHNAQLHQNHFGGGGGFTTTAIIALAGLAIGYVLDMHPVTRRIIPYVQPAMERMQRHQLFTPSYDDLSDHQQPPTIQPTPPSPPPTPPPPPYTIQDTLVHPSTLSIPTNPHFQTIHECPLSGSILYFNLPPNTPYSLLFAAFSLVLHSIVVRCTVLRPRRELSFLLHLQSQIQTKTTTIPEAARHCKTSEKAIKAWLHNFEEFANGPIVDGDDD